MKKRSITWIVAVGIMVVVGYLIYGSTRVVQASCYVCVEYGGQTQCRTGTGADVDGAQKAAQKAACAVMASGMSETIACENAQPTITRCPA